MRNLMHITLLFTAAACIGCAQEQSTATAVNNPETTTIAAVNEHCPIMGGEVTDDGGRVEWNGKTIGFCCPGCIEKFEALSDDDKSAALAKAAEAHKEHDHGEHDHGKQDGAAAEAS